MGTKSNNTYVPFNLIRHQILLNAARPEPLQKVLAEMRAKKAFAKSDRIAVDVDPVSLL